MGIVQKIRPSAKKEKQTPDEEAVKQEMEDADVSKKKRKELGRILEMWFLQSFQAGEKAASIQGTKRDKVYMLTIINTISTIMLILLVVMFQFYM